MGLTMWRWSAGVAVACAAVACALLPFPPADDAGRWIPAIPAPLAAEVQRLTGDLRRTQDAVRAYRSQIGLARWRSAAAGSDSTSIRLDQSVPARLVGNVRAIVAEQWAIEERRAVDREESPRQFVSRSAQQRARSADDSSGLRRSSLTRHRHRS